LIGTKRFPPKYKKLSDIPNKKVDIKSSLTDWDNFKTELLKIK